jgi:hypothetical protein
MVHDTQELIVISREGIVLRTRMEGIAIQGRSTQGVAVINLGPGDAVASVAVIEMAQQQGGATAEGPAPDEPPAEQMALPAGETSSGNGRRSVGTPSGGNGKGKKTDPRAALSKADAAIARAKATNAKSRTTKPAPKPKPRSRR